MKIEIVANSCRVCLTRTKKLRSLYKPIDEGDEPPNKMLHLITGISVEKLDELEMLPKSICKNCELSLSMAYEFRENALKSEQTIAEYLNELQQKGSNEENGMTISIYNNDYEEMINLERLDCVDALDEDEGHENSMNNNEELSDVKNEQVIEEFHDQQEASSFLNNCKENVDEDENTNENYFEHKQENEAVNEENDCKMSDGQEEFEYIEERVEIVPANEDSFQFQQTNFIKTKSTKTKKKKISKKNKKLEKIDINLTENIRSIPRRGRKPSNNANENAHICDICGNLFAKRGRMMEHRQRHDKEAKFGCEICDRKFFTRELLRKHIFSHSGGKPLKCEFCSRTFYYESVRKAHESVHKGLRPHICDVCDKSFSYAHALKKHKLIHAEIKLYRCVYCNKDFRLQHHMKQHQLTKLHQNAVRIAKGKISLEDSEKAVKEEKYMAESILFIEEISNDQIAGAS